MIDDMPAISTKGIDITSYRLGRFQKKVLPRSVSGAKHLLSEDISVRLGDIRKGKARLRSPLSRCNLVTEKIRLGTSVVDNVEKGDHSS